MLNKVRIRQYKDEGYKYLAQDRDCHWFAYKHKPNAPLTRHGSGSWDQTLKDFAKTVGKTKLHSKWATMLRVLK